MPLSKYAKNRLMDHFLSGSLFLSLHSSDPGDSGESEVSGGAYARKPLENSFSASDNGEKKLGSEVLYEDLPKVSVSYIGVWDSSQGGNLLWSAKLTSKKDISEGDALKFKAGHIILGLV
jgi:hypothetical protein